MQVFLMACCSHADYTIATLVIAAKVVWSSNRSLNSRRLVTQLQTAAKPLCEDIQTSSSYAERPPDSTTGWYNKVGMATGVMLAGDSRQHLVVQGEVLHVAADGFPGPGSHSHHLEPGLVQLLRQVVNSHIGGCCHQHLHPAPTLSLGLFTTIHCEL